MRASALRSAAIRWIPRSLLTALVAVVTVAGAGLPGTAMVGLGARAAAANTACPCSLWSPTIVPKVIDSGDGSAVELGVQFSSQVGGSITGIRFFKAATNTGIHVGSLWTSGGTSLAQATFSDESTAGWQDVTFSAPVAISANTVYVAGYHTNTGHYSVDPGYFSTSGYTNAPLTAPGGSGSLPNGLFVYSPTPAFPTGTFNGNNYWVDVDFTPGSPTPPPPNCPCTLWGPLVTPTVVDSSDGNAVELGVQFAPLVTGTVSGVRFYKAAANTGTHIGSLWAVNGGSPTLLAQATFSGETSSGWQQVTLSPPVAVTAGTLYVAGYHTSTGHYAVDSGYFNNSGYVNPPLQAPGGSSANPNGLFVYSATPAYPTGTFNGNNYWVDVVFTPARVPVSITVGTPTATPPKGTTEAVTATESFSDGTSTDVTSQVSWSSTNPSAATVSSSGLLSALAVGATTISASLAGLTGSSTVTVAPAALTAISVSAPSASLPGGVSEPLQAIGTYTDGTSANLTSRVAWTSSAPSVVSVSSTGVATAGTQGRATVTASLSGLSGSAVLTTLAPVSFIYVHPVLSQLSPGQSEQLTATAWLTSGQSDDVTSLVRWATLAGSATVSSTGLVTAVGSGLSLVSANLGWHTTVAVIFVGSAVPPPWGH